MRIYGLTLDVMNDLATLGMVYNQMRRNTVTVLAGDAVAGVHMVFYGSIQQAWTDFSSMPDVSFNVEAQTLGTEAVILADSTSISGAVDVAAQMEKFAKALNLDFENNGITTKTPPVNLWGSIVSQAAQLAKTADINWFVDNRTLAIWPKGNAGSRGGTVPIISKDSGLVGYPGFTAYGISLKMLFNPDIKFGGRIKVESDLSQLLSTINSKGFWQVYFIDHHIESNLPHGQWFTTITCFNPDFPSQLGVR